MKEGKGGFEDGGYWAFRGRGGGEREEEEEKKGGKAKKDDENACLQKPQKSIDPRKKQNQKDPPMRAIISKKSP